VSTIIAEATGITRTVNVQSPSGDLARTAELPANVFDVQVNVPLIHQVVVAQLAAARQGTADTKTRGEVSGGGKKPYRQKGTGRARQGSIRSPQFAGGGVAHGPTPRNYEQRTPKKMKAAALRGALSDRARHGRVHVVSGVVDEALTVPSTKAAAAHLRNLVGPKGKGAEAVARESELDNLADAVTVLSTEAEAPAETKPVAKKAAKSAKSAKAAAVIEANTEPAGEGISDEEMIAEVKGATSRDLKAEPAFEADGAGSDTEAAKDPDGVGK
jgi:50S ribosomal protein L4